MADAGRRKSGRRKSSSRDSSADSNIMGKARVKSKKPKERWLLTRKTWRYMADASRRLIPEGALNRPEDVPKIEAYFQEVCQKEPRFLLWRKSSYPGALGFKSHRRRNRKGGSCRTKSSSADECDDLKKSRREYAVQHISGGRFDIQKLKQDFWNKPPPQPSTSPRTFLRKHETSPSTLPTTREEDGEEKQLIDMLHDYLKIHDDDKGVEKREDSGGTFDYQALVDKLQQHLNLMYGNKPQPHTQFQPQASTSRYVPPPTSVHFEGDHVQKTLLETLSRYYSKSPNRQRVISDLLTDRKLLEKLYFDLRKTKGFRSTRGGGGYSPHTTPQWRSSLYHYSRKDDYKTVDDDDDDDYEDSHEPGSWKRLGKPTFKDTPPMSPPPLIEIQSVSFEAKIADCGIQTEPISEEQLLKIEEEYKKMVAEQEKEQKEMKKDSKGGYRRRSSVDHDDVSQSVSDTIKRYLRMARKKSVEQDKVDRFKRVNYDKNLRFIKAKGEITKPGDDDGLNKGCQTVDDWILRYRDLKFDEVLGSDVEGDYQYNSRRTSSRSSFETTVGDDLLGAKSPPPSAPSSPSSVQSFLSSLLHGKSHSDKDKQASSVSSNPVTAGAAAAMQKSKSSSSVVHHGSRLVAKKIWRSRSKSQTRLATGPTCTWSPQGQCTWANVTGRQVTLNETSLLQLSEIERRLLQQVALAKLQALNLGVTVKVPTESVNATAAVNKPKRRAYLLKRKAITTSFFDNARAEKDKGSTTGLVFGIPLNQCIENDRLARIARGGSPFRSRSDLSSDEPTELRRQSHHGSRTSFSSLIDTARTEEVSSCESLMSRERIGASVPGLLDALSSSTSDIAIASSEEEPGVPQMVTACLRHLEAHGLNTLGIFRVSSSKKRVRQLREDFDTGKEVIIDDDQCPHDVATLLKEYLRDLPDPLLCRDLYQAFVQTQKIRNRRLQMEAIQYLIQLLPVANRDTLWALLNFLATVARHSADQKDQSGEWIAGNKMDSNNLATVFAPNILHCIKPSSGSGKEVQQVEKADERIDVINVIRSMIDHNKQLFQVSSELLDEVYLHMMDSHPEALDKILSKKAAAVSEFTGDDLDSECSSTPRTPTTSSFGADNMAEHMILTLQTQGLDSDGQQTPPGPRKVWSREEFLHGTAGMGGPNMAMKIRHKEKERGVKERLSKKRWRDEGGIRRYAPDDGSGSELMKSRSASIDSSSPGEFSDNTRVLRITEEHKLSTIDNRRLSSPLVMDNANVVTASLKIPLQPSSTGLSLNLDDPDIPFIEDSGGYTVTADGRQQMTIGIIRGSPIVPPRRRHRSMSGSDSSQASVQPVKQTGYDSAVGSSATFSSPPRNTPSSVGSGDGGMFSSPPSWASSPPTSPDSSHTTVNYIPDDGQHAVYSKMTVPLKQTQVKTESMSSAILQKVTFTSASEIQQRAKQIDLHSYSKQTSYSSETRHSSISSETSHSPKKSASTSSMPSKEIKSVEREQKFSPSISSIGGAVLRSRTADFERMMRMTKTTVESSKIKQESSSTSASNISEKKKYVKRRYTDSRHQTKHIPDTSALEAADTSGTSGTVITSTTTDKGGGRQGSMSQQQGQVYKRRELIASVPKDKRSLL